MPRMLTSGVASIVMLFYSLYRVGHRSHVCFVTYCSCLQLPWKQVESQYESKHKISALTTGDIIGSDTGGASPDVYPRRQIPLPRHWAYGV